MRIAIDLNDVIRDFSNNFLRYYCERYNHEYDLTDFEMWTNNLKDIFPFKSDKAYENFTYNDFVFELFGKCDYCSKKIPVELNEWCGKLTDIDTDEEIDVMLVSPFECGLSIGQTFFFLAKLASPIRKVYFPKDSADIWNQCDVLITANPQLLDGKPSDKYTIRIETDYNKECKCDCSYSSFIKFLKDENKVQEILNNGK